MARSVSVFLAGLLLLAGHRLAHATPGEVTDLRAEPGRFSWNPEAVATEYRVYRGALSELSAARYGDCYAPGLTGTALVEPAEPPLGEAYFYLVTAVDETGEGTAGSGSPIPATRPIDPCVTGDSAGLNVSVPVAEAYELEDTAARFRITRSSLGLPEITVQFTLLGDDDVRRGSASSADYVLTDTLGTPVGSSVVMPQGVSTVELLLEPVQDALIEVPETLQLQLLADPSYALGETLSGLAQIKDATNVTANERLFLAFLSSENGAETFASGVSVVRLRGDNDEAIVDLSFSGLTSPQNAVHIHVSNPVDGPHVESLPLGQVSGHVWAIEAAQFLLTDQQVLDALFTGLLYVNVHSTSYPAGEIRGQYGLQQGSTELQIPPDPPALPVLTGDDLDRDIARFLTQATFGPTPASMDELRLLIQNNNGDRIAGMGAWIDAQIDLQQTPEGVLLEFTRASSPLFTNNFRDRRSGWWLFARYGRDQLRQRVAFALSELLVISDADGKIRTMHLGASDYYDLLIRGAFGSYRDLLLDVSLHPTMGYYLSHLQNQKELLDGMGQVLVSPDENYAREVMQLFSFGLIKRHLDGTIVLGPDGLPFSTYDNAVITQMAKVFTGLSFSKRDDNGVVDNTNFNLGTGGAATQVRWLHPMKMFQSYHDEGAKTIFDGHVIPAGQDGMVDIETVHDLLVAHPTTAPFVSRRLIQRLVTSNPSRGYVYRVAQRFEQTGGDLGEVVRAILLDHEARSLDVIEDVGFGKQKEPLLRMTAMFRLLDGKTQIPLSALSAHGYSGAELAKFPVDATIFRMQDGLIDSGQIAQSSPTVFNFFLPDFTKPGALASAGLVAPEFQISTESQMYELINDLRAPVFNTNGMSGSGEPAGYPANSDHLLVDLSSLQAIYDAELAVGTNESASEALVDHLDLYLNGGGLKHRYAQAAEPNPRSLMIESIVNISVSNKMKSAVYIVVNSPQFSIQR